MINWLTTFSTRPGPGIDRNAPKKTGAALLLDVVARNWWELIQLNLLIVLFSLPIVTIPAAQVAAARVIVLMLEDRPIYLGRDFWEAFTTRFWRATALGLAALACIGLPIWSASLFLSAAGEQLLLALPFTLVLSTGIFALLATLNAVVLLAMRDLPLGVLIRLALLGALARPLPALGALAVVALLWLLHILFYPVSIFMPAVINFSFGMLAVVFGVHQAAVRLLGLEESPSRTCAEGSAMRATKQREGTT